MSANLPCAVLMCHAPIVVPQVGGSRGACCRATTRAMEAAARRLVGHRPDVLVVVSPHTPRRPREWSVVAGERLRGDFSRFGVRGVGIEVPGADTAAATILEVAAREGVEAVAASPGPLDHGATVPLTFLAAAGWDGPTVVLGFPHDPAPTLEAMGRVLAAAARESVQKWALLASGDMSHRLAEGAPAGFHPRAADFDRAFVEHVAAGDLRGAATLDPELREIAAEDVVDSVTVAAAAVDWDSRGHEKLCYEGPFGVGYLEAVLHETPPRTLVEVARDALTAEVLGEEYEAPELAAPWDRPRGVFVTLWTVQTGLRGCIGRIEPRSASLAAAVADCAVAAGTRDPRFRPVKREELGLIGYDVSVLDPPEPASLDDLDPARYGVVVSLGRRKGVLLPGVVDVAHRQVELALQKAGIDAGEDYRLERFGVGKVR